MYKKEYVQTFLEKQGQLFDEPVADDFEEAEAFLEDCMAVVLDSLKDVKKYLGLKVRAIREAAGMTQEELAATCDVSWRTISNLERGTVVPDLVMIYKISQEFNISIDEMLDNKIADNKSLSRLEKENQIIEKIRHIDDNLLDYIDEQLRLLLKHFHR